MAQQKRGLGKGLGRSSPPVRSPRLAAPSRAGLVSPGSDARRRHRCACCGPAGHGRRRLFPGAPIAAVTPNPRQPRQVFDEDALDELVASIQEVGLLQPVVVREIEPGALRAGHGRAALAGLRSARGLARDPGDRPRDHRRRDAAGRPAGEPAPGAAQPAGRSGRVPAAARGLRRHPRGAGPQDRPLPPAHLEHDPAAEPAGGGPAPGGGRRAHRRARPGAARARGCGSPGPLAPRIVAEGLSVRAVEEIVAMAGAGAPPPRGGRAALATRPGGSRRPALRPLRYAGEGRARQRKGKIVVEFGTLEDLERIVKTMSQDWSGSLGAGSR